jgi:hypothetical protein
MPLACRVGSSGDERVEQEDRDVSADDRVLNRGAREPGQFRCIVDNAAVAAAFREHPFRVNMVYRAADRVVNTDVGRDCQYRST